MGNKICTWVVTLLFLVVVCAGFSGCGWLDDDDNPPDMTISSGLWTVTYTPDGGEEEEAIIFLDQEGQVVSGQACTDFEDYPSLFGSVSGNSLVLKGGESGIFRGDPGSVNRHPKMTHHRRPILTHLMGLV